MAIRMLIGCRQLQMAAMTAPFCNIAHSTRQKILEQSRTNSTKNKRTNYCRGLLNDHRGKKFLIFSGTI